VRRAVFALARAEKLERDETRFGGEDGLVESIGHRALF